MRASPSLRGEVYSQQTDLSETVKRKVSAIRDRGCGNALLRNRVSRALGGRIMEQELTYYRRRAAEETEAAASSAEGKVREIHLELCRRYDERASNIEAEDRRSELHAVSAD